MNDRMRREAVRAVLPFTDSYGSTWDRAEPKRTLKPVERRTPTPMEYPREPLWKSFAAALCVAAFVAVWFVL